MTTPDERPVAPPRTRLGPYELQPLTTLDGVLIAVTANGETVAYAFGSTYEIAAAALARDLMERTPDDADGADR